MAIDSPRITEYGSASWIKNGLNMVTLAGDGIIPRPVTESIENAVMIHEVIVSGAREENLATPSDLRGKLIFQWKRQQVLVDGWS